MSDPIGRFLVMPLAVFLTGLAIIVAIALSLGATSPAKAQQDHSAGHDVYKQWRSEDNTNCCDGRDCGTLPIAGERWTPVGQLEVNIEGQWCPVKPGMYVRKHKSPDWNVPHVCVTPADGRQPCERLRCYMGKGAI
jgi:hypothetical protein